MPTLQRNRGLDCLRGVAIGLVMSRHFWQEPGNVPAWLTEILEVWTMGGWWRVDLFFVLSGFLVSGLLMRESLAHGSIRPFHFLLRRGLRIWPGFYLFFAVIVLTSWPAVIPWSEVATEVTYPFLNASRDTEAK